MNRTELRKAVSQILIKWGMGTRQIAIIEIVNLIEAEREEAINMAKDKSPKKEVKKKKKAAKKK